MNKSGFSKLYWGFLFIMIDFRIQGVDILPDIIGFILFATGFSVLAVNSTSFKKAGNYNIFMIVISIFSIYEQPAQGGGIHISPLGVLVGIVSLILGLMVVYYLFMGIKEIAKHQEKMAIYEEAGKRWMQYLLLQLAALVAFVLILILPLAIVYVVVLLVVSLYITILIMGFMKRCGEIL